MTTSQFTVLFIARYQKEQGVTHRITNFYISFTFFYLHFSFCLAGHDTFAFTKFHPKQPQNENSKSNLMQPNGILVQ
ncbi:MAG: hypothetical protein EAZ29_05005 [Runella slithyformis]|nr:MAG: hypothetical protein EAZ29_05005 [Runella slithyformis]